MSMSGETANGKNRRSWLAAKPASRKAGREKITLLISKDTDVKLSTLAGA